MPLVFDVAFPTAVISLIESIGGGVDGGSEWGAVGRVKQELKHKWQCCAISRRPSLTQLTGEARSAVRISLAPNAAL